MPRPPTARRRRSACCIEHARAPLPVGWPVNLSWIPNAITVARLCASAPLAWLILHDHHAYALAVAFAAGVSDALDGLLAKRFNWQSRMGGLLDPIADKLMLFAAFLALTIVEAVPLWLTLLVIARDVVIVLGAVAYHTLIRPLEAAPTTLSKANTVAQILLVLVLLVDGLAGVSVPQVWREGLIWLTAGITLASGLHYVVFWGIKAVRESRAR